MNGLMNLKIGIRLGLAFGSILVLMMVIAGIGLSRLGAINAATETIVRNNARVASAESLSKLSAANASLISDMLVTTDQQTLDRLAAERDSNSTKVTKGIEVLAGSIDTPDERAAYDRVLATHDALKSLNKQVQTLATKQHDLPQAIAVYKRDLQPTRTAYNEAIQTFVDLQYRYSRESEAAARSAYESARQLSLIILAIALVLGAGLAIRITRSITLPLTSAVTVITRVASGDFSQNVVATYRDEVGVLLGATASMVESISSISSDVVRLVEAANKGDLTARGDETRYENDFRAMVAGINALMGSFEGVVAKIRTAATTVSEAAREIAQGNGDLSQRTSEQASSLEETASSMEELTSTVSQNVENARQANQLTIGASEIAIRGGQMVGEVVQTMGAIQQSSRKIVDIISVIDGIAFQVNILALNAAVEAARAGEQGRGFAVVAGEVRSLAQRSAAAAKEIKALISDSVEKADAGNRLVEQTGKTMDDMVTAVKRVADIMSEINAASIEQGSGIEQVNQAVTQMDEVTQQNAALVEEAAASAASLEEQAATLVAAIAIYKLSDQSDQPAARAVPAKPAAAVPKPTFKPRQARVTSHGQKVLAGAGAGVKNGNGRHTPDEGEWESF